MNHPHRRAPRALDPASLLLVLLLSLAASGLVGCIENADDPANETADAGPGGGGGEPAGGAGGTGGAAGELPAGGDPADAGPEPTPDAAPLPPDAAPPPACAEEDGNAGNQDAEHATPVLVGFDRQDLYLCAGTEDWYAIPVEAGAFVSVQLTADPVESDLDLFLVDAAGAVLAQSATETGAETAGHLPEATGTVYAKVVGGFRDVSAAYRLSVQSLCRLDAECPEGQVCSPLTAQCEALPGADCGVDAYEENDRDADAAAFDLGLAGPAEAVICGADPDWFEVTVSAGDSLEVLLSFPSGEDLDLIVRNLTTGALVGTATGDANTNPERLRLSHLAAGDYAVGIFFYEMDAGGTRDVEYRLDMATTPGRCGSDADCTGGNGPVCTVETGVCGPVANAGAVELGGQCGASADCAGEASFCAGAGPGGADNYCTVECGGDDAECAALGDGAYCLRSGGAQVCARACEADTQCSTFRRCQDGRCQRRSQCESSEDCAEDEVCAPTPFGALFCQARPAAAQCGYDFLPDGSVRADDDREHTVVLPLGDEGFSNQMICDGDLDWFQVTVPAESAAFTLQVTAAFRDGVDIDVYVQDAAGNTIGGAASADQTREIADITFIAPGEYFVIVDQFASDALDDSTYTVSARIVGERTPCTVEGNECASTEPLRMTCNVESGACVALQGDGEVALGGLCDSNDDCGAGAEACWTFEGVAGSQAGANICTHTCGGDGDCMDVPGTECVDFQDVAVCLPPR
jgi:hypothetical protein